MPNSWVGADGLGAQIQAAREFAPGLEIQQLKASVRARLFGGLDGAPSLGGYTLRRMIGRGGMGAVFEAVGRDGDVVALKALRGFEPAALYRFKLEFRALADIAHPNLALLHHLVVRGDQAYLTMELVDGVDFLAYVREGDEVDLGRLRAALAQLVAGLEALHAAGKLHRDIKPSNVLVTREGRVVILDFGLVQELAPVGGAGAEQLVGTPAYMAPEQLRGRAPSEASDWYAVGVMLYEALAGRLPFSGATVDVLRDKCERDAPALPEAVDPQLASLCAMLLAREPEQRPSGPEMVARLDAPVTAVGRRFLTSPLSDSLIGREPQLERLGAALRASRAGPTVALVRGRSGMGKTALLHAFAEVALAGAAGPGEPATVLAGRCYEREQVPYNAFDSAVDALTALLLGMSPGELAAVLPLEIAALARLFPVLRRVTAVAEASPPGPPHEGRASGLRHAIDGLKDMFQRMAARRPLVLMIDDVQWTDGDSAALLADLLLGPGAPPCLVVLGCRADDSCSPELTALLERLQGLAAPPIEVAVDRLRAEEAAALAAALLRRGPSDPDPALLRARATAIAGESGGVPLFVRELVHHVRLAMAEGTNEPPARLEAVVADRAAKLPAAARSMIEAVAVAGRPLELSVAAEAAGAAYGGRRELQLLRTAHLVRASKSPRGELVEPYHDRIRDLVAAQVTPERRRELHRRVADVLLARPGTPPEELADHLRAAGDLPRAAEFTRVAADRAADALALRRAAELYREAAGLLPRVDVDGRRDLLVRAGDALAVAGRSEEAAECLLDAAELGTPLAALELRQRAAEQLLRGGAYERAREMLLQVLQRLGEPMPRDRLSHLGRLARQQLRLWRRGLGFTPRQEHELPREALLQIDVLRIARLSVFNFDPFAARLLLLEHLLQCLELGEPGRVVRAFAAYAAYLSHAGDSAAARGLLDRGRALIDEHLCAGTGTGAGAAFYVGLCAGMVAHNDGCFAEARAHLMSPSGQPSPDLFNRGAGAAFLAATRGVWLHSALAHLGDLAELGRVRAAGVAALRSVGDDLGELRLRANLGVFASLAGDAPDDARRELEEAERAWPEGAFPVERGHVYLAARAVDLYAETGEAAWSRAQAGWPAYVRGYLFHGQYGRIAGRYWRAAAALHGARAGAGPRAGLAAFVAREAEALAAEERRWAARGPGCEGPGPVGHGRARGRSFAQRGDGPRAHALLAGVASLRGRDDRTAAELAVALAGFEAADLGLFAAAARWHCGRLLAADRGGEMVAEAEAAMRAAGVAVPGRMARALLPGLG